MDKDTITFLRSFCSTVKEMACLCDTFLENEQKKKKNTGDIIEIEANNLNLGLKNRLIPLSKWNQYYDYPSISALRSFVFFEDKNGFKSVVRRVGRRVLICEKSFFEWVDKQKKTN